MKSTIALAMLIALPAHSPSSIPIRQLTDANGDKVTCKLVWQVMSRIPDRICRTDAEWQIYEQETQADWRSSRNGHSTCQGYTC